VPTFVQQSSVASATGTSATLTFSSAASSPNGIVVLILTSGALAEILAPTDSFGNSYTKFTDKTNASALSGSIWYVPNSGGGVTTVQVNFNSSQTFMAVAVEVGGGALTDTSSGAASNTGSPAPGSITTGVSDTIVFAILRSSGSISATPAGYTTISETDSPAWDFRYKILSSIGAENPTWTLGSSAPMACIVASFKSSVVYTANSYGGRIVRTRQNYGPWQLWAPLVTAFPPPPPAPFVPAPSPLPVFLAPVMYGMPFLRPPIIFFGTHPPPVVQGPYYPPQPARFHSTHPINLQGRGIWFSFPTATPVPTDSGGVGADFPWFPRVPKPTDPTFARRMAQLTEKLSDALNSLLRGGYLVQDSDGTWHIQDTR